MPRGFFITFEGLDGSGKTTQLRRLATWLTAEGRTVVTLRNPGSTPLGDRIRAILLDSRSESTLGPITPLAEMALMFADRAQSIADVIAPALTSGAIVLCDRYTDSSEAYQGAGRQLGSDRILAMHAAVCNNLQPDLTILSASRRSKPLWPAPAGAIIITQRPRAPTKTASSANPTTSTGASTLLTNTSPPANHIASPSSPTRIPSKPWNYSSAPSLRPGSNLEPCNSALPCATTSLPA